MKVLLLHSERWLLKSAIESNVHSAIEVREAAKALHRSCSSYLPTLCNRRWDHNICSSFPVKSIFLLCTTRCKFLSALSFICAFLKMLLLRVCKEIRCRLFTDLHFSILFRYQLWFMENNDTYSYKRCDTYVFCLVNLCLIKLLHFLYLYT